MSGDVSDDDDVTIWAGRLRASPTPPASSGGPAVIDDATLLSPRHGGEAPDDATALASRPRADALTDETALASRLRADAPTDETALTRRTSRATPVVAPEPAVIRTRGSVKRPAPIETAGAGRDARVLTPGGREIFRPRAIEPDVVVRAVPRPQAPQEPVVSEAVSARGGRRRRRRFAVGVAVSAVLVVAAAVAIVWLVVLPG
ncbi:hypothetical protein ACFXQA_13730 [Microbacterium sp. P07]|uniref:hypothetical protein n=1 Tax=Microbacterium sp. P07 TaxID=3366952 RepID=UPI0037477613